MIINKYKDLEELLKNKKTISYYFKDNNNIKNNIIRVNIEFLKTLNWKNTWIYIFNLKNWRGHEWFKNTKKEMLNQIKKIMKIYWFKDK